MSSEPPNSWLIVPFDQGSTNSVCISHLKENWLRRFTCQILLNEKVPLVFTCPADEPYVFSKIIQNGLMTEKLLLTKCLSSHPVFCNIISMDGESYSAKDCKNFGVLMYLRTLKYETVWPTSFQIIYSTARMYFLKGWPVYFFRIKNRLTPTCYSTHSLCLLPRCKLKRARPVSMWRWCPYTQMSFLYYSMCNCYTRLAFWKNLGLKRALGRFAWSDVYDGLKGPNKRFACTHLFRSLHIRRRNRITILCLPPTITGSWG